MYHFLSTVFFALISTSLSASIMTAILLAISQKIDSRFQPRVKVLLWNLVCLRFLLFVRISIPISTMGVHKSEVKVSAINMFSSHANSNLEPIAVTKPNVIMYSICVLSIFWIIATIVLFIHRAWDHYTQTDLYLRASVPVEDKLLTTVCLELCQELKIKRRISLLQSEIIKGPIIFGLFKVSLVVPKSCNSEESLRIMLYHELTHLKHHDIWSRLLLWLVCTLHWFNPIVYIMQKREETDIELSCDYDVLLNRSIDYRKRYRQVVLQTLSDSVNLRAAINFAGNSSKKNMFYRLSKMTDISAKKNGRWLVLIMIPIIALACLAHQQTLGFTGLAAPYRSIQGRIAQTQVTLQCPVENPTATVWPYEYEYWPDDVKHRIVYTATENSLVYAPISGEVTYVGFWKHAGMGNTITIKGKDLIVSLGHLNLIDVAVGSYVELGMVIGEVGESGAVSSNCTEMLVRDV